MKQEDRQAIRAFYQTLAFSSGAVTKAQIDFYLQVLKGDSDSRRAWAATYVKDTTLLDPVVVALLMSAAKLDKTDIAVIAASYVAPKVQNWLSRLFTWIFGSASK